MSETPTERRDRIRQSMEDLAFGPEEPKTETPSAPKKPGAARRALGAVKAAGESTPGKTVLEAGKGVVGGVTSAIQSAGQHIANAILPPNPAQDSNYLSRGGEALLGILHAAMAPVQAGAGAAGGAAKAAGATGELPEELSKVLRTAQFLFSLPEHILDPKARAEEQRNPEEYRRKLAADFNQPATWDDLAEFLGGFAGGSAAHGAFEKAPVKGREGSKAAPKPGSPEARAAARAEAEAKLGKAKAPVEPMSPTEAQRAAQEAEAAMEANRPAVAREEPAGRVQGEPEGFQESGSSPPAEEPTTPAPIAPGASYNHYQQGFGEVPGFHAYDLNEPFTDAQGVTHPKGTTKSESFLQENQIPYNAPAAYADAMHEEFLKNKANEIPGATFNPRTGAAPEDYGKMFVASNTRGGAMITPAEEFGPQHIRKFADQHAAELAELNAHHGIWEDEGQVYQDVSRRVPTRDEALQIARSADERQKAIWDEANNQAIPVDEEPTGAAAAAPEPETPPAADPNIENALPPDEQHPSAAETMANEPGQVAGQGALEQVRSNEQQLEQAGQPVAEPVGEAPGEAPVTEGENAAAGAPQIQNLSEVAETVAPAVEQYGPPTAADYLRTKAASAEHAESLRQQGLSRAKVNEGVRQFLNERGILSQNQIKKIMAENEAARLPQPSSEDLQPEHINEPSVREELEKLKQEYSKLHDKINDLLGTGGESTLGMGVPLRFQGKALGPAITQAGSVLNQMGNVGAAIMIQGAKSFKAYAARMREEFGDIPDKVLKKLYEKSQAALQTLQNDHPEMLTFEGLKQAFTRGKAGMLWYDKAPEELAARYGPENVKLAADVYAATSPGTNAATVNIDIADKAIRMILSGERDGYDKPFTRADGVTAGTREPAQLINLNKAARGEEITGPKIGPYAKTLAGIPDAVDAQGNPVFRPVFDTWMMRLFKFIGEDETGSPNNMQRDFMTKVVTDIAKSEGVTPYQVQAAMWVAHKTEIERARVRARAFYPDDNDPFGNTPGNEFKPGWDNARLQREYDKIARAEIPFDQLLQNRLEPAIQAGINGDTAPGAGGRLVGAKVTKALMEPGAIEDPSGAIQTAIQSAGIDGETANGMVPKVLRALKDRLNSTDPEGAALSTMNMGFNPLDLMRLFKKDKALESVPFDAEAAKIGVDTVRDSIPNADEALRADLRDEVTPETSEMIKGATKDATANLQSVMSKDVWEPGELTHAATVAGALAEKARNAEVRQGRFSGRKGPVAVKPITDDALMRFAESMHEMSEPELYQKLKSMDTEGQQRWLANDFRASNHPAMFSAEGLLKLYQGLYFNEILSSTRTLVKSFDSHFTAVPWLLARSAVETQIGRLTRNAERARPGQTGQWWEGFSSTLMDHYRGIAKGDIEGLKQVMEQEGDLHRLAHGDSVLDSIVNLAAIPSYALGAIRSPIKNALRQGALYQESWRRVMQEADTNAELKNPNKFIERLEDLRKNPDDDLLQFINDHADEWSFTKSYDGIRGKIQDLGPKAGTAAMILADPFVKIGANLMTRAAEMNPASLVLMPSFWRDITGGHVDRALGKFSMGAGLLTAGAVLQQMGVLEGSGPADPNANRIWREAGHSPYSVKNPWTGEPQFSLKYLGIFAPVLASGAALSEVLDGLSDHSAQHSVLALAGTAFETFKMAGMIETYSHIVTSIASGINDNGKALFDYLRQHLEGGTLVFPGSVGLLRDLNDLASGGTPEKMAEIDNKSLMSQQLEMVKQDFWGGIPGWSENMPMIRSPFTGEITPRMGFFGARNVDPSEVAAEVDRLEMARNGMKFTIVKPKSTIGGSGTSRTGPTADPSAYDPIPLTAWQYDRKLQLAAETKVGGKTLNEALLALIHSSKYQQHAEAENRSPEARREGWCANAIQKTYNNYEHQGEQLLLKEDKHLQWEVAKAQWDAQQLQSLSPREFWRPEPEVQSYPRPGQNDRK